MASPNHTSSDFIFFLNENHTSEIPSYEDINLLQKELHEHLVNFERGISECSNDHTGIGTNSQNTNLTRYTVQHCDRNIPTESVRDTNLDIRNNNDDVVDDYDYYQSEGGEGGNELVLIPVQNTEASRQTNT